MPSCTITTTGVLGSEAEALLPTTSSSPALDCAVQGEHTGALPAPQVTHLLIQTLGTSTMVGMAIPSSGSQI